MFLNELEFAAGQPIDPNAAVPDDFGEQAVAEMKALNSMFRQMLRGLGEQEAPAESR